MKSNEEERLMVIEMALAECAKTLEELNEVVIEQGKKIEALVLHQQKMMQMMVSSGVKELSEETPPPHY